MVVAAEVETALGESEVSAGAAAAAEVGETDSVGGGSRGLSRPLGEK